MDDDDQISLFNIGLITENALFFERENLNFEMRPIFGNLPVEKKKDFFFRYKNQFSKIKKFFEKFVKNRMQLKFSKFFFTYRN